MIMKGDGDEPERLAQLSKDIAPFIDKIFVTFTGAQNQLSPLQTRFPSIEFSYVKPTIRVTQEMIGWVKNTFQYDPCIQDGDEIFLFDEARNFNFNQVPKEYEWILWIDCDDVFRGTEKIRGLVATAEKEKADVIYLNYLYQVEFDENKKITQVVTQNPRERLVRNGKFKWRGMIHEILLETAPTIKAHNTECDVVHIAEQSDRLASLKRNIKSLEVAIHKTQKKDVRYLYYLAKCLMDVQEPAKDTVARTIMQDILLGDKQLLGEERSQAWNFVADLYIKTKEYDKAIQTLMNGLMDDPKRKDLFISLAMAYMHKGDYEKALFWVSLGNLLPEKTTLLFTTPRDTLLKTLEIVCGCYLNMKNYTDFRVAYKKLLDEFPSYNFTIYRPNAS